MICDFLKKYNFTGNIELPGGVKYNFKHSDINFCIEEFNIVPVKKEQQLDKNSNRLEELILEQVKKIVKIFINLK